MVRGFVMDLWSLEMNETPVECLMRSLLARADEPPHLPAGLPVGILGETSDTWPEEEGLQV